MTKRRKKILIICLIIAIFTALSAWGFAMETVDYQVESQKLSGDVKIVFISDLHNCFYGDTDNTKLWEAVCAAEPDLVLFGGDVIDYKGRTGYALDFMERVQEEFPCAYTPGNHEGMRKDTEEFYQSVREIGVPLLMGDRLDMELNGQEISLFGVVDAYDYGKKGTQLENCYDALDESRYNILLAHQPEQYQEYMTTDTGKKPFDLILSGHAHGGQWAIPGILPQGLYAPDQGIFPERTTGVYYMDDTVQIISRGLARPLRMIFIPRIFNRPELSIITIGN